MYKHTKRNDLSWQMNQYVTKRKYKLAFKIFYDDQLFDKAHNMCSTSVGSNVPNSDEPEIIMLKSESGINLSEQNDAANIPNTSLSSQSTPDSYE